MEACISRGLTFIENSITSSRGNLLRQPLGNAARFVLQLVSIRDQLVAEYCTYPGTAGLIPRIDKMITPLYSSLLLQVFGSVVKYRSAPHESMPTAAIAGNEISHWPGIDVGLVLLALLRGRPYYDMRSSAQADRGLSEIADRICPPQMCDTAGRLPLRLPLFITLVALLKQQVVGYHNADEVRNCLQAKGIQCDNVHGAFVATASLVAGREFQPTIYLW